MGDSYSMGRTKGAKNKRVNKPDIIELGTIEKLDILADLLLEVILEESTHATAST